MDIAAKDLMRSKDGSKYTACISNKKTGASCQKIEGYKGPSITVAYEPGQEIDYRVGACQNAASQCSFAKWKEHTIPGKIFVN